FPRSGLAVGAGSLRRRGSGQWETVSISRSRSAQVPLSCLERGKWKIFSAGTFQRTGISPDRERPGPAVCAGRTEDTINRTRGTLRPDRRFFATRRRKDRGDQRLAGGDAIPRFEYARRRRERAAKAVAAGGAHSR